MRCCNCWIAAPSACVGLACVDPVCALAIFGIIKGIINGICPTDGMADCSGQPCSVSMSAHFCCHNVAHSLISNCAASSVRVSGFALGLPLGRVAFFAAFLTAAFFVVGFLAEDFTGDCVFFILVIELALYKNL